MDDKNINLYTVIGQLYVNNLFLSNKTTSLINKLREVEIDGLKKPVEPKTDKVDNLVIDEPETNTNDIDNTPPFPM